MQHSRAPPDALLAAAGLLPNARPLILSALNTSMFDDSYTLGFEGPAQAEPSLYSLLELSITVSVVKARPVAAGEGEARPRRQSRVPSPNLPRLGARRAFQPRTRRSVGLLRRVGPDGRHGWGPWPRGVGSAWVSCTPALGVGSAVWRTCLLRQRSPNLLCLMCPCRPQSRRFGSSSGGSRCGEPVISVDSACSRLRYVRWPLPDCLL